MTPPATPQLCDADDATFWAWHRWPEFSRWANPAATVVVIPIAGFADWGLDRPLDVEETILLSVLRAASEARAPDQSLLVTPPLRFVVGPDASCAFAVDVPTAHAFIAEVAASVVAAGFRRIVLFNASPWNEELVVAASRDLRIALGVQLFTIHLSGLGLDFLPSRSPDRTRLLAALDSGGDAAAAQQLRALLGEIQNHPPLAHGGRIPAAQP
jgi:creatinine amidohydrolase